MPGLDTAAIGRLFDAFSYLEVFRKPNSGLEQVLRQYSQRLSQSRELLQMLLQAMPVLSEMSLKGTPLFLGPGIDKLSMI